jgi:DNA-binding transcriptional ArsR family regulator
LKQFRDITDPSLAKALAHPLRTRILAALENRTASPSELAEEFGVSVEVVSYHVRRLAALRFLKLVRRVPRRGALEHYYTITAGPLITSDAWGATPSIVKHATVDAALKEIASHVNAAAAADGFDLPDAHISRIPMTVDREGFKQIGRELDALMPRIQKIEAESAKRLARADHQDEHEATAVLMLFTSTTKRPAERTESERRRPARPRKTSRRST